MNKIYVASALTNYQRVLAIQTILVAEGFTIAFDWAQAHRQLIDQGRTESRQEAVAVCQQEAEAIKRADMFLLVLPAKRGAHVEFGIAAAYGVSCVVLAEDSNLDIAFYGLPGVTLVRTFQGALASLRELCL